ncbi:aminotransferase class V-fold PLP-dependent enzyme [Salinibacter grassmerensis]|uniref:aminotransferase class V-fold PLP-dependent enzyme n=1 Tax=Salinibacter grassmerensis TaxID=3040353 RepID=UPI0021E7477F|nr:aminotransferase class V-fold PLP-dependent enzyme [Salinibacter grassmerensis]
MHPDRLRAETPGTDHVLHFNNAGAALPPQPVLDAQITYLEREATIGGYEAAAEAEGQLHRTYESIARMLGCDTDEVALVENATRAWDMAFYGLPFDSGDRILTSASAYASNHIACLQVAERTGATVDVLPHDEHGRVDTGALRSRMDDDVALIALTHVPTNGGLVNPAQEVGAVADDADVPFLLDACQSAGQMPLPVDELGCTMLSATGRKYLRGPRGTGFLYVQDDWIERIEPPLLDLHAATWTAPDAYEIHPDARRFENWESHVAGQVALGVAVDYALDQGLDAIFDRNRHLARTLRTGLADVAGVTVHDQGDVRCGITTFSAEQKDASTIQAGLRERDVNTAVSPPSSTRLDAEARALPELVRASVHYYNTEAEVDRFVGALRSVLRA